MELEQAIRTRRSIRVFSDRPVARDTIERLLEVSRWAPSGMNAQPWRVTVATGERLAELAARFTERAIASGQAAAAPDVDAVPKPFREKVKEALGAMSQAAKSDGISLAELRESGFRFNDAPVALVVTFDGDTYNATPAGVIAFVTTMLLMAHEMGLGTCWMGMPLAHMDLIHGTLDIPSPQRVAAFVALGYPKEGSVINAYRSPRDSVEAFSTFLGFEAEEA